MNNSYITRRISDILRKNKDEGISLLLFSLPSFVYRSLDHLSEANIPVFSFHSVKAETFENQLKFLSENGYRTLDSGSFIDIIIGKKRGERNSVVLTFDDGRKSLWTTAYPLLKKYNLSAISFIVPSVIKDDMSKSSTLEDVWSGQVPLKNIDKLESEIPFCNWNEIKEMHESGLVDFQSHSMYHASVFVNKKLVDFVNPDFRPSLIDSTFNPIDYITDRDSSSMKLKLGSPIYNVESNLTAKTRYVPNEKINISCMEYVQSNGGTHFFNNSDWRDELELHFTKMKRNFGEGEFQSFEKRVEEIKWDLLESRKTIENYLNKPITHLCLPWYFGNKLTVQLAKETGYSCVYWGIKNMKSINLVGDDPFYIRRINDYYIFSLPGKNRVSLSTQIMNKFKKQNLVN